MSLGAHVPHSADEPQYDVLIVGGGMVGAALALALDRLGLNTCMLEAAAVELPTGGALQPVHSSSFDARSTALSWGSRCIFEQMGLWSGLARHVAPIEHIHVSERGRYGSTRMTAKEMKVDALGYVIQNQWLGQSLYAALGQCNYLSFESSAKVSGLQRVTTESGEALTRVSWSRDGSAHQDNPAQNRTACARLLVVADGAASTSCRLLGIDQHIEEYDQHAVIANLVMSQAHQQVAYERFTSQGPMALLPLEQLDQLALVWTVANDEVQSVLSLDERAFGREVETRFGERLGAVLKVGERVSYPLKLVRAREQIRPGVVVLGNAAHALHPVAGQGFNLALRGVAMLVEHLASSGDQWAEFDALQAYYQDQQQDQNQTIAFSDQVTRIFTSHNPALGLLRDIGLVGLEAFPLFRQLFARQAMGLGGRQAYFATRKQMIQR